MLRIINLSSGYGDMKVLDGISMHVAPGEAVALLGANGAGKSTLLKTVSGLIGPKEGRILLDGNNITGYPAEKLAARGVTFVPEGRGLFPDMSVTDNLKMGAYSRRLSRKQMEQAQDASLESFPELKERLNQRAGSLSGGQQQMLAIAKALMASPKILILDEPSTGLAPLMVSELFSRLLKLKEEGLTLLFAEQNAGKALKLADRAYVLENGRIILEGTSAQLADSEDVRKAYIGV